jgi:hypothetical protein
MAVPSHALDSHYGNVAPEAAEAFDQCYIRAGTSCAYRCCKPTRSRTDNQHIGFMNYINFANWLDNLSARYRHVLNLSHNRFCAEAIGTFAKLLLAIISNVFYSAPSCEFL